MHIARQIANLLTNLFAKIVDRFVKNTGGSGRTRQQSHQDPNGCRFSSTVGTKETNQSSPLNLHIDRMQNLAAAIEFAELMGFDYRHRFADAFV